MNFEEAEKYLLSLGNEVSAMKLGLLSIRKLLAALGHPEDNYLKVQVAGTNGKGSVCAFLNSICLAAGIRTGMYTSPHLVSITERIKIDGVDISEDDFARLATCVRETSENLVTQGELENIPTFFEQVTAIALLALAEAKVQLAIIETGLGGRLDATTAANAEIAAITRIDLDHQQYLGETIEEIAAEKAAIIQEGSRVVIGEQQPGAMDVILERCRTVGVTPTLVAGGRNPTGREGVSANYSNTQSLPPLALAGRHQIGNARIAVATAAILREHFSIYDDHIARGIKNARHPGRLERIGRYILDGAHNAGGAKALLEYLEEFVDRPITMVFGAMQDKNISSIASILFRKADKLILTRPKNSRAASPDDIVRLLPKEISPDRVIVTNEIKDALVKARDISGPNGLIIITGSLYLVGEARRILKHGEPNN